MNFVVKFTEDPVNFAKFLRPPFLVEHLLWLLLGSFPGCQSMWYFSRNTICFRMNIIFFNDARYVRDGFFSWQGHLSFFLPGGQRHSSNAYAYIQKTPYFQRFFWEISSPFFFRLNKKYHYFWKEEIPSFQILQKRMLCRGIFLEIPSFQNIWKKYLISRYFSKRLFLSFVSKDKIKFSGKSNIIFLDNTRKIISQCNFFGKIIFSKHLEKKYGFLCSDVKWL